MEAQKLGYAESDPTADVSGQDAASKAAIIAMVAFGADVSLDDVLFEGIQNISSADVAFASRAGCAIKLLAMISKHGHELEVQVYQRYCQIVTLCPLLEIALMPSSSRGLQLTV